MASSDRCGEFSAVATESGPRTHKNAAPTKQGVRYRRVERVCLAYPGMNSFPLLSLNHDGSHGDCRNYKRACH